MGDILTIYVVNDMHCVLVLTDEDFICINALYNLDLPSW